MSNFKTIELFGRVFRGIDKVLFAEDMDNNTIIQLKVWNNENNRKQIESLKASYFHESLIDVTYLFIDKFGEEYFITIDKDISK